MSSSAKKTSIAIALILLGGTFIYLFQHEAEFMVEFGDSIESREAFAALLEERNVTYRLETDHVGRV